MGYKNELLERKTKAVADTIHNQMITSIDVLLALYSNEDIVSQILSKNGFSHEKIKPYHYTKYDSAHKNQYIISNFAKVLLNTENNEEAIATIVNNECVAKMALDSMKNLTEIIKDFFKEISYYNSNGDKIKGNLVKRIQRNENHTVQITNTIENKEKSKHIQHENNNLINNQLINNVENININKLRNKLVENIIGQDNAIETVLSAIMRAFCGLTNENTPKAKFLFCGPTGVGKTQLAKTLSEGLGYNLIKIDMSEYQEKVSITKLIGAAPGYAGYEEGGQLTSAIEKNPKSVIIFDEIEKAHHDIFSVFLQILDEGRLTDNKGDTFKFNQSIIIFTSNVGANNQKDYKNLNYNKYEEAVKSTFKPEFINRLDDIVIFNKLDLRSLIMIIGKELELLKTRLENKHQITMEYDENFISWFIEENIKYINFNYGAREIYRLVQKQISSRIAEGICNKAINQKNNIKLVNNNKIYQLLN